PDVCLTGVVSARGGAGGGAHVVPAESAGGPYRWIPAQRPGRSSRSACARLCPRHHAPRSSARLHGGQVRRRDGGGRDLNTMVDLEVAHVSKRYWLPRTAGDASRGWLGRTWSRVWPSYDPFWALHDVSFSLERGEAVGIIGPNGAGKS